MSQQGMQVKSIWGIEKKENQGYKCATKGNIRRDSQDRATTTETTEEDSMFNQKEQRKRNIIQGQRERRT